MRLSEGIPFKTCASPQARDQSAVHSEFPIFLPSNLYFELIWGKVSDTVADPELF